MKIKDKRLKIKDLRLRVIFLSLLALVILSVGCDSPARKERTRTDPSITHVPEWSRRAIWYQIFVERFRNGDKTNDPAIVDMKGGYPDDYPDNWEITPWGHDWYSHEPWLDEIKADNFYSKIQARRYGGDLQGVLDEMDYIQLLGVNAVYFNPLNDSPSLHKYDARNYTHIDRNFGPDPEGDIALIKQETPDDPTTWVWTTADRLFLKVIKEFHRRNIKVIMDYSWNHTGKDFWALNDVRKNGRNSKFADWYNILEYDNPDTPEDEFKYEGWGGSNPYMPVFRKDIIPPDDKIMPFEGNLHSGSLKQHIFNVSVRWLDPDKDGNPSDGVDGFRLDVAGEVPMGFWREYRKVVRSVNTDTYLVGEIWWLEWPDKLLDPAIFIGDQFDAVMNYRWFRIARGFFARGEPLLNASGFVKEIERINKEIGPDYLQAMMNVAATHDSPRLSTSVFNKTMYKTRAKPSDNPDYRINKPDMGTIAEQKLLLVHQYTFVGSPHIWNGDEAGMWGADDPDCRKPIVWDDLVYDDERANYNPDKSRPVDIVKPDKELFLFYRQLIRMRKENPVLSTGNLKFLIADDKRMVLVYSRSNVKENIIAVFNRSDEEQIINIPVLSEDKYKELFPGQDTDYTPENSLLKVKAEAVSAVVLKRQ